MIRSQSLKLSSAHQRNRQEDKVVYEAYGTRRYSVAPKGGMTAENNFYDPAVNHKPVETSVHPGFKSHRLDRSTAFSDIKEMIRHAPDVKSFNPVESKDLHNFDAKACRPNNPDFVPEIVPAYIDFNRRATPFKRKAIK